MVASAADAPIPTHAEDGSIEVDDNTGIVFVLLPGGRITVGSQSDDPDKGYFDDARESDETLRQVKLEPFLLARHELTQGQWVRLWLGDEGERAPSAYSSPASVADREITGANPVEQVDWTMSQDLLRSHGLTLPTEAQWEYGCRGGSVTPWCSTKEGLARLANVASQDAEPYDIVWKLEPWKDGHVVHAPVGSFLPNAFGLHDMHGNVWEWCNDEWDRDAYKNRSGTVADPSVYDSAVTSRSIRGGNWNNDADSCRSWRRTCRVR